MVYRRLSRGASACRPPGATRFVLRRPCTRWWPVRAAVAVSLSPTRQSARESPVLMRFHFGPCTFNFVSDLYFCYVSFDLVRLGPSIEINVMSMFPFNPPSFNSVQQFFFLILSFD